jgi:hypothetical protein
MRNSRPLRSRRARARIALSLCVLWLAGYEVLPWLHIATHAHVGKHHHDASGAIVLDDETFDSRDDEHDLDAEVDEHGAPVHHDHDLDAEVDEHGAPVHHDRDLDTDVAEHTLAHHDDDADAEVDEHGAPLHDDDDEDADVDEHGQRVHHAHHHGSYSSRDTLLRALGHGQHSLAHHAVATTAFPPVLTEPLPIDRRPTFVFADTAIEPYSFSPGRAVARGPPAAAFES